MTAFEKLKSARSVSRPTSASWIKKIISNIIECHGDREFGDDSAIMGGIARLADRPVTFIGIEKGTDIDERMKTNFGCPKPEGYRKALRLMKQAEKFGRPVVCFVDTMGAYCGAEAEERGQGEAIARNIMEMMGLTVPIITVIVGEGGSGGALALAAANRVYMLENAVYSVISPEGCASILWKDSERAPEAAERLHITAADMMKFGVAENIIDEDFNRFRVTCMRIKMQLEKDLEILSKLSCEELVNTRYERFRNMGYYNDEA